MRRFPERMYHVELCSIVIIPTDKDSRSSILLESNVLFNCLLGIE